VAEGDLAARVNPLRDRDDLDALAMRVDDTTAQLDRLMRQTRDFSANIAHDLKTPLTRLRIRLETALTAELETGESADQIGAALEQTETVIGIFDAFLRIAKLESGATKAEFVPLKLADLAAEVTAAYGPVIEDAGRIFSAEVDPQAQITGDRILLIQMLANMIENAMRHTPEGTSLRLVARDGVLGLADDGPGIPEDEHDKVLQPLYRLDKSRTGEGAGLGLALVRTIAELHGATVVLSPDPATGRGLFIRAEFPTRA
jgi:signal transduction histidine kinase